MATLNISLPESLRSFVDDQVTERGYATSSEYVCELIRQDQGRQDLRGRLLDGASSPLSAPVDEAYFDRLKARPGGGDGAGSRR
jgi:antitoxin ParD1/3/4